MYLQNIMSNYLNEERNFEVKNSFKPLNVKKTSWNQEEKKLSRSYEFEEKKFLEAFIVELLKYNREADAQIEVRFLKDKVGIVIHSLSSQITEIELEASKDIDKIKKDVMYYYASK
jgi:hypothetical protein